MTVPRSSSTSIRKRRVSYDAIGPDGQFVRGSPTVFQSVGSDPIAQGVEAALQARGTTLVNSNLYFFHVAKATSFTPADFVAFERAQAAYFQQFVIAQGDPNALAQHVSVKKFIGGILSVGTLFIPLHPLSAGTSAQVMLNSGVTEDVYNLTTQTRALLTPAVLPLLDPASYTQVDAFPVKFRPDTPGQIVIAYKVPKTPEIEQAALIQAIVTLTGADTTPEAVEQARQDDFTQRVAIWNACVAAHQCPQSTTQDSASAADHASP